MYTHLELRDSSRPPVSLAVLDRMKAKGERIACLTCYDASFAALVDAADVDGLGAFAFQWTRGGADIPGANGASLVLGQADVGQAIAVRVTFTDGFGATETLTSAATAPVATMKVTPVLPCKSIAGPVAAAD